MAPQGRLPSRLVRQKKYGIANQLAYEASQKVQREALKERLASQTRERRARGAQMAARKRGERGMNAGTMGGSRR